MLLPPLFCKVSFEFLKDLDNTSCPYSIMRADWTLPVSEHELYQEQDAFFAKDNENARGRLIFYLLNGNIRRFRVLLRSVVIVFVCLL